MTKNKLKVLIISAFLVIVVCCTQMQQPGNNSNNSNNGSVNNTTANSGSTPTVCDASAQWVSDPNNPPTEIPGKGQTLCQFHQFSWQWFISLMNKTAGAADRVFEVEENFPLLKADGKDSCDGNKVQSRLFVRTGKNDNNLDDDFSLPERIKQAGKSNQATIYDQNGNVVFYEVRFSRKMCNLDPTNPNQKFEDGTTELKVSYRVITESEKPDYVWINADINGDEAIGTDELLGMVGFHLVISTKDHPEFIWASFEHKRNAPDCLTKPDPNAKWSFTSANCAAQLPNSVKSDCAFNFAPPAVSQPVLSGGKPSEVCRVYHGGSNIGDTQNIGAIDALNTNLNGILTTLAQKEPSNPLAVLKNYELIGTLWLSTETDGNPGMQVGSIQLANSTMETTFQQAHFVGEGNAREAVGDPYTGPAGLKPAANCFTCHAYTSADKNVSISHIFTAIKGGGQAKKN